MFVKMYNIIILLKYKSVGEHFAKSTRTLMLSWIKLVAIVMLFVGYNVTGSNAAAILQASAAHTAPPPLHHRAAAGPRSSLQYRRRTSFHRFTVTFRLSFYDLSTECCRQITALQCFTARSFNVVRIQYLETVPYPALYTGRS